jgi:hypothetical protein
MPITDWVADFGTSNHTTPYSGRTSSPCPPPSAFHPRFIVVGNGSILPITSVGDSALLRPFYLNDVLVTPNLIQSLFPFIVSPLIHLVLWSLTLLVYLSRILSVPHRPGTPCTCFRPRQKARYASTCYHVPPRYWNPPSNIGRAPTLPHAQRLRTPLAIQEGSGAATRPSAPYPASPLRRDSTLTCVLQLRTAPTSVVGSDADMCHMALHGSGP